MRQSADCKECLLKADLYADNELSALEAAAVLAHTRSCAACRADIAAREAFSAGVKRGADYHEAPAALKARVAAIADAASPARAPSAGMPWTRWALPAFSASALALSAMLYLSAPSSDDLLADEAVSVHVRSLMENHIADVASTDQHTVKPWFAGRIDFSPPVHDFAAQGYPLTGGRLDYIGHQPAAALVYHRNKHVINVLVTSADGGLADAPMKTLSRRGYNIVMWRKGHLSFEAVSDLNAAELSDLCRLISDAP